MQNPRWNDISKTIMKMASLHEISNDNEVVILVNFASRTVI
jgi:hypothetical protein